MADKDTKDKEKEAPSVPPEELASIEAQANADADADAAAAASPSVTVATQPEFLAPPAPKQFKSQYDEAVAIIQSGRAVQFGPNVYTRVEDLPPASVLARGDIAAQKRVLEDLKAKRDKVLRDIEALEKEIAEAESRK